MSRLVNKILITGGAGFIGSHVCDILLETGYTGVGILDYVGHKKVEHIQDTIKIFHGDIRRLDDCVKAVEDVDIVIHLAALINVDHSIQTPRPFYETNVGGTMNLLDAIRQSGTVKKFVYMSTAEVYGTVLEGRITENTPCDPRSPYAASKYAGERYCLSYYHTYGSPEIVVLRGFNTFGPRQTYGVKGAVIAIFISRILRHKAPVIFGDGSQMRDYVYVKDLARGIVLAALATGHGGEIINLGVGIPRTIKSITKDILELMESDLTIEYIKGRLGEVMKSVADSTKAKQLLGWDPRVTFEEGLIETIKHYKEVYECV